MSEKGESLFDCWENIELGENIAGAKARNKYF